MNPRATTHILTAIIAIAALSQRARAVDFEKEIQPIFKEHCYECHSELRKKEKSGYVFDNLKRFKNSIGPNLVVEPGDPSNSQLFILMADPGVKNHMPPKGSVSKDELDKIRKWIAEGATFDGKAPKGLVRRDLPPIMKWTNAQGVSIKAGFGGVEGDEVIFKMPNGTSVKYAIAKLSPESQQLVKECASGL